MAAGRNEARIVSAYLDALTANAPRRGRKRTAESVNARLEAIETELDSADMITRLNLVQERMNLTEELTRIQGESNDLPEAQAEFIKVAASYGDRRGITYAAWREIGVPPEVLREAGVSR